jgi:predicted nucleotidyltransferase
VDDKAKVILYGSRAHGDEKEDSDWEILILMDEPLDLARTRAFRYPLYDLALELGEQFSVFVHSKNEWNTRQRVTPFYDSVKQEGILL